MAVDPTPYDRLAALFGALTSPIRLQILESLVDNHRKNPTWRCCVSDIMSEIELPQPYISKHLKVLKECGILEYEKKGNRIYYSFAKNDVLDELIGYLRKYRSCC
ncbi:MAG TPA: metalloregulator ArsR/SmtB family transcription factor [Spirochaetota bacterium]|nr:metalloregulator ArsR/SmtB family transcription factor [Spirochaetota bacterium]HNT09641.1 metalloregulator ArsR/SmtB family transcription factor [Spirochaetota bacterium]HNV45662.1 metalloregulator ArsR/SmtB family transcription factor [Spirochaetota bacterium]HOS39031.1 metalloregulator ArsR/SmtB family transcription factor [Spirochaetota bacterium]HPI22705.1 metalloregulator ArsR/SmtB family transcription factor [Spirochaetota bacterium]